VVTVLESWSWVLKGLGMNGLEVTMGGGGGIWVDELKDREKGRGKEETWSMRKEREDWMDPFLASRAF